MDGYTSTFGRIKCQIISTQSNVFNVKISITQAPLHYICIAKDKPNESTCLYCSKNHKSSQCPSKRDKTAHKCANCIKSNNPSIKKGAVTHCSTNKNCPIYIKEVEKLKLNTCYDQQEFMAWSSRNQRKIPLFPVVFPESEPHQKPAKPKSYYNPDDYY